MSNSKRELLFEKFGKSFEDIKDLKTSFFYENDLHLRATLDSADFYLEQPRRTNCKICDSKLEGGKSFLKHKIPYTICGKCTHLNGRYEDTNAFCESLYTANQGIDYAKNYSSADQIAYQQRCDAIYRPKAEFMLDTLRRLEIDVYEISYLDVGAGAGYFVSALKSLGVVNVTGYEVGAAQVALADKNLGKNVVRHIGLDETTIMVENATSEVVSFIGVFEHLQNPREILKAIQKNKKIKYFYFCVPLFSTCIFNEMAFPNVMPRQLAKGHTHLFTKKSIDHFLNEFGFEAVSAWWFGTDLMDLYRSIFVSLRENSGTEEMADEWLARFGPLIDEMQLVLDERRESSQVHMFVRCNGSECA